MAKLGSVSRAAAALFVSQPAVTRAIQKLEAEYGCALFHRNHKGMALSTEGAAAPRRKHKPFIP